MPSPVDQNELQLSGSLAGERRTYCRRVWKKKRLPSFTLSHWDPDGPTNPTQAGATLAHLVLIKCQGTGIRQEEGRAHLILHPVLYVQTQGRQTSLSSFVKPYLAYYENF